MLYGARKAIRYILPLLDVAVGGCAILKRDERYIFYLASALDAVASLVSVNMQRFDMPVCAGLVVLTCVLFVHCGGLCASVCACV